MKRWPTKSLGELVDFVGGGTPRRDRPDYWGGEIPWASVKDLQSQSLETTVETITAEGLANSASNLIPKGTVIIASRVGLGKVAINRKPVAINQDLKALTPRSNDLLPRYLLFFLLLKADYFERTGVGATVKGLTLADYQKLNIVLPPVAEQERIVKLLDESNELLKLRVQADRRTAAILPSLFYEMFGRNIKSPPVVVTVDDTSVPKGWRWSRLVDVARLATGHTPSRQVPDYWNGNIPWISLTDIRALDGTVAQATSQSVTEKGIENSSAVKLPKGTVCFSRTASVGFVTVMGREMCTSQDFVNWVCGNDLDPIYLMGALIQAREHLRLLASGSTHKTIYFPTVEKLRTVVPPLPLQKEYAQRVTVIRELEADQATSRHSLNGLFESALYSAFNGEL